MGFHFMNILLHTQHKTKCRKIKINLLIPTSILCILQNTPTLGICLLISSYFIMHTPLVHLWHYSINITLSSTISFILKNNKDNCITPNSTTKWSSSFVHHINTFFNVALTKLVHKLKKNVLLLWPCTEHH